MYLKKVYIIATLYKTHAPTQTAYKKTAPTATITAITPASTPFLTAAPSKAGGVAVSVGAVAFGARVVPPVG